MVYANGLPLVGGGESSTCQTLNFGLSQSAMSMVVGLNKCFLSAFLFRNSLC